MILFTYIYKILKRVFFYIKKIQWIFVYFKFKLNRVKFKDLKSNGIPITDISIHGRVNIGRNFQMNNGYSYNIIGRQQPCCFIVGRGGELIINNNVGISSTAIVCWNRIEIGNNVRIGGGTVIYDTDFHSLDYKERISLPEIKDNVMTAPVLIKQNAFIGANSTILKGVTIGEGSVVGACSVVTKDVPDNEVWGGNPAKFIKSLKN
ncbi:acyltransferase [Prevotella sp. 10(H)]|uniref:acyltransferase n=1 Tax=Prevotella sp. 10(H) TaxID=1158294 RepID=UPI0004A765E9|nr:acyltransferase [Prevotella sp. 10(H)]